MLYIALLGERRKEPDVTRAGSASWVIVGTEFSLWPCAGLKMQNGCHTDISYFSGGLKYLEPGRPDKTIPRDVRLGLSSSSPFTVGRHGAACISNARDRHSLALVIGFEMDNYWLF